MPAMTEAWEMSIALRFLMVFGFLATAYAVGRAGGTPSADPAGIEFFEKRIRPLLAENCYQCHGPEKQRSALRLDSMAAILKGGERGPAVVPGKLDDSLLIRAILRHDE